MPALREIFAEYDVVFDRRRQLETGQRRVSGVRRALTRLQPAVSALSSGMGQLAVAFGGAAMVHAFTSFISHTIDMGDALDKTAQQLGLSTRELQAFQHAANLGGVDSAAFAQSMGQLQRQAELASRGSGEAAEMFERLGVSVTGANGELRTGSELLVDVARGLTGMENSTERVAISSTLMGRSGRRLLPMMASISEGTADIEAEMDRLGGGMSEVAVGQSVALTDSLARMRFSFLAVRSAIAERVLPVLNRTVRWVTEMVSRFGGVSAVMRTAKAAIVAFGAAALIAGAATIGVWGPTALAFLAAAAGVAVLGVVFDELDQTIEGADSELRKWLDSEALLGQGGTEGLLLLLSDRWDNLRLNVAAATEGIRDFLVLVEPLVTSLGQIWSAMSFLSGGFFADAVGGTLIQQTGDAARARAAEERTREQGERARATRARDEASVRHGESSRVHERINAGRFPSDDVDGQMSMPSAGDAPVPVAGATPTPAPIPRSTTIQEITRSRISERRQQNVSIEAPAEYTFNISEATDAEAVTRLVTREVNSAQNRMVSEIESMISDQTEVGS